MWDPLTSIHTLFVREHNRIAAKFSDWLRQHTGLDGTELDEKAYQEARRIVAAEMQVNTIMSRNEKNYLQQA